MAYFGIRQKGMIGVNILREIYGKQKADYQWKKDPVDFPVRKSPGVNQWEGEML